MENGCGSVSEYWTLVTENWFLNILPVWSDLGALELC